MTAPGLVSCGYQSHTAESLVERLLDRRVGLLADVRLTPMSRTRGLAKKALAAHLSGAGIEYVHLPSLGNPKENRAGFAKGDPQAELRYLALLEREPALQDMDWLARLARGSVVAVMCFERQEEHCHRRVLLKEMAARDVVLLPPI
ncbi:DUF488 domain-containing protein [Arthrobacter sp. I2-34]|uniref:DUF488 domain-containing protein n=1 Tax=Arthrobacter hankyongi TaxID=2904801 RepID=A0ABS9LCV8_9MICC|nr:DUF488 domain-containing protein [Arthrobacter hankyongi]MCG2624433.1 DUF488 domain-containing protein [Arthrobacter hankyongi]